MITGPSPQSPEKNPPARPLVFAPRALKELSKLPNNVQRQIGAALERFAATGFGDLVKLTDVKPPTYRLRVRDWRVMLALSITAVTVERIVNRRDAY